MHVWKTKSGDEVAVLAATWEVNHKITFENLLSEFRANPLRAARNYASIVTYSITTVLPEGSVAAIINTSRHTPFDPVRKKFYEWFRGKAGRRYFLHYDLSVSQDNAGVALSHREPNGSMVVDWMWGEVVPEGRKINFAEMRQYAYDLRDHGFLIEEISYDQFQSEESRQVLEEKGFSTFRESSDKDTIAYDTLVELVMTTTPDHRKFDFYNYELFVRELEELRLVNGKKYDHPKKFRNGQRGSKDVADAVACSIKRAILWHRENGMEGPGAIKVFRGGSILPKFGDERSAF